MTVSDAFKLLSLNRYRFFVHKRIISAVKKVRFVSDRMSFTILRGRWCNIIVVNVHVPTEDTIELEQVYDKFPRYRREILLGDFIGKAGREDIVTCWLGGALFIWPFLGRATITHFTSYNT
jgi:hypothetical protein